MIQLLDIDPGNWRLDLAVSKEQRTFVSDRAKLLARAYAYRAQRSWGFLICADGLPVGMGLYYDEPELQSYELSQMFIDERYQGRGYGRAAVRAISRETRPRESSTKASASRRPAATGTRSSWNCLSKAPLCKGSL